MQEAKKDPGRIVSLDYLRGYFVTVIIIDHLSRFPSLWQFITGRGILWTSAAEGFVMISGMILGYVRGHKGLISPYLPLALKILKRAAVLYVWMVISSLGYVALTWELASKRDMPWYDATVGDWPTVFHQVITMELPHLWVHFLYLYTIFLLVAVPAIWLLRQRQPWILAALSVVGYIYGLTHDVEWLRMQVLFFFPMIAGFYLPYVMEWWQNLDLQLKKTLAWTIYATTTITLVASVIYTFFGHLVPNQHAVNELFNNAYFGLPRVMISMLWFTALVLIFNSITPWLHKHTKGVLEYLGTHSLTAYIAHGVIICAIAIVVTVKNDYLVNTAAGILAVFGTYALIKLPLLRRILPR